MSIFKKNKPIHFESFEEDDLGIIHINPNPKAKNIIFRPSNEGLNVTCPIDASEEYIRKLIQEKKANLIKLRAKLKKPFLWEKGSRVSMLNFEVVVLESGFGDLFQARFGKQTLEIVCPSHTNYQREEVQAFIQSQVIKVLKMQADKYLPSKTVELAQKWHLKLKSCNVSYGKQRLGRCDSKGNILLSYRLMMLPPHLCSYVILHELTHLTEMNHGESFHQLLNHYCEGKHPQYHKELNHFIYPL